MIKRKRMMTLLLSLSLIIPNASIGSKVFASPIYKNNVAIGVNNIQNVDLDKISKSINYLLSSKYEIMKTGNFINSNKLIKNSRLLELFDKTNQFDKKWYKKNNITIDNYNSKINIVNISKMASDTYLVDVTYDVEFKITGRDSLSKSFGEKYRFEVKSENDEYYITKMLDLNKDKALDESSGLLSGLTTGFNEVNYDNIINKKISDVDNKLNNFDGYYEEYKKIEPKKVTATDISQQMTTQSTAAWAYNYYGAVDYAHQYAMSQGNDTYTYFAGNDCTNFVSQCVHAGGVPTNFTWNLYTNAWVGVIPFYNYMTSAGYAYSNTWTNNARTGDIVQFYSPSKATWSHSVILTGTDPYGNWVFCGHSTERYDYPLSAAYADNGYTNERTIAFWH